MSLTWKVIWTFLGLLVFVWLLQAWPVPVATAVALGIIIFQWNTVITVGGKTIRVTWLTVTFLAAFFLAQVVTGFVFDAGLGGLYEGVGQRNVLTLLFDPRFFGPELIKQLACLVFALILAGGYIKSDNRDRWHKLAGVICLCVLSWESFNAYAPLPKEINQRSRQRTTWLRRSAVFFKEGWKERFGKDLAQRGLESRLASEVPPVKIITVDTPLYQGSDDNWIQSTTATATHSYYVFLEDNQTINNLPHPWIQSVDDPKVAGYAQYDHLADDSPKPVAPEVASAPAPPELVVQEAPPTVRFFNQPAAAQASTPPSDPPRSKVREDEVLVTADEWVESIVIPYPGDVIEFGPFNSADEVKRLLSRTGGLGIVDLEPVDRYDGRFVGQVTIQGSPNFANAPERLKLKSGEPISVRIRKVRFY